MKIPGFTVCAEYGSASVHWQDETRKYHFWLRDDGTPSDDVLHSNPIVPSKQYGVNEHRSLDMTAKRWAPLIAAIMAKIAADDLLNKARAAHHAKLKADAEERQRAIDADRLKRLSVAVRHLPPTLNLSIEALPDDVRARFVAALEGRP